MFTLNLQDFLALLGLNSTISVIICNSRQHPVLTSFNYFLYGGSPYQDTLLTDIKPIFRTYREEGNMFRRHLKTLSVAKRNPLFFHAYSHYGFNAWRDRNGWFDYILSAYELFSE